MNINILELFEFGALRQHPERVAIRDFEESYTFKELEIKSKQFALSILLKRTVNNCPIAVFLPKTTQTIVANLGVLYTGNFYANIDVNSPPDRLRIILDTLAPTLIITSAAYHDKLHSIGVSCDNLLLLPESLTFDTEDDFGILKNIWHQRVDADPFCIVHTSGSTGVPKGVTLTHRGAIDFMQWAFETLHLDGSEVIGSLAPFYFDIYIFELLLCLAKGATFVIIPEKTAVFPILLVDFLKTYQISLIFWVPTIMVSIANKNLLAGRNLSDLKKIFFAGEVFPTKHLNYWRAHNPTSTFVNLYGPIEIHVDCTYFVVDRNFDDDEKLPIGFPCRNTSILILNDRDVLCAAGETGELCVRGSSLSLGYWNSPERTAKAFVQNPTNPHYPDLIYRTGDLVSLNERGEIMFLGRKDFQIKHLGYRIELGEIEHAVLQVPGIQNCCIVYHQEKKSIILFFESVARLESKFIRENLMVSLPKYMLPNHFERLDFLPRNPNGKIDREALNYLVRSGEVSC